jgi:hypothetical protein
MAAQAKRMAAGLLIAAAWAAGAGCGGEEAGSGGRLKTRVITTSDGAKQFAGFKDTQRGENCTFQQTMDGKLRCVPEAAPALVFDPKAGGYFSEAGCQTAVVVVVEGCAAPKYAVLAQRASWDSCGTLGVRVFQVGTRFVGTLYKSTSAGCVSAGSVPTGYQAYLAGTVAPEELVEGTEQLE